MNTSGAGYAWALTGVGDIPIVVITVIKPITKPAVICNRFLLIARSIRSGQF